MSTPAYHGWTHAPKEMGGSDPIPLPAAAALQVCLAKFENETLVSGTLYGLGSIPVGGWEEIWLSDGADAITVSGTDITLDPGAGVNGVYSIFMKGTCSFDTVGSGSRPISPHLSFTLWMGTTSSDRGFTQIYDGMSDHVSGGRNGIVTVDHTGIFPDIFPDESGPGGLVDFRLRHTLGSDITFSLRCSIVYHGPVPSLTQVLP